MPRGDGTRSTEGFPTDFRGLRPVWRERRETHGNWRCRPGKLHPRSCVEMTRSRAGDDHASGLRQRVPGRPLPFQLIVRPEVGFDAGVNGASLHLWIDLGILGSTIDRPIHNFRLGHSVSDGQRGALQAKFRRIRGWRLLCDVREAKFRVKCIIQWAFNTFSPRTCSPKKINIACRYAKGSALFACGMIFITLLSLSVKSPR
jgi:hypothetical protein